MRHVVHLVNKTKQGQVRQTVREHYVRDDVQSGAPQDPQCDAENAKLGADAAFFLVPDTDAVLQQADFLEHESVQDVIILSTVFNDVHKRNTSVFLRLKQMLHSGSKRFFYFANEHCKDTYVVQQKDELLADRHSRAVREAAKWYRERVQPGPTPPEIVVLTLDTQAQARAQAEGLVAPSLADFADKYVKDQAVLDLIAWGATEPQDGKPAKRRKIFTEHLPFSQCSNGIKAGRLHQGTLATNRNYPYEGKVNLQGDIKQVLVKGREALNRAFDGDVVVLELLPEAEWQAPGARIPRGDSGAAERASSGGGADANDGADEEDTGARLAPEVEAPVESGSKMPTGRVVSIATRNWRQRGYAGSLKPSENITPGRAASLLFAPVERRFPFIRVSTRQATTLMDKRIVVVVDEWPADSAYPMGHYHHTIGPIGDLVTETEVLLLEYDVNTAPFSAAVHACVPPLPWSVTDTDRSAPYRRDLRHIPVCSVDPPGCKDIDDALHARTLPNGNIEVGVHIADVTHFVHAGSAMDEEAARRSTTVYLVDRRIDMLPKPLTEDICSLRGGVERLAFSVIWELTPEAEPINVDFTKSIIRSRAALTYEAAQNQIDGVGTDEVSTALRLLMQVARVLRRKRYEAGALNLASPELKISRKDDTNTNSALDVKMYELRETNMMVEEMMLMANIAVGTHIHATFPACAVLRRHEPPTPEMFEPLMQIARVRGIKLDAASSKRLAESLDAARSRNDPYFNKLLRILATRCMTQAKYFSSGELAPAQFVHYGLAVPIYTHFTSPIRRYADVLVHRCLAAALGLIPLPEQLQDRQLMAEVVDNMNVRHINAQMAGRASTELHTKIFFRGKVTLADARVVKVQANGLVVFVPKFGIEGPVFFGDKGSDSVGVQLNEARQEVTLPDGSKFKIFDMCAVKIWVDTHENHRESLKVELIDRSEVPKDDLVS